jgi:N utilization substance protein B
MEDIGSVEKSILRLAIYEILFEDLQKAIVINEAIELSKKLASDGAPKFVNGLLDKVVKA